MEPESYEEWLELSGIEDTEEARGWYECEEGDRAQYIEDHKDWWENW